MQDPKKYISANIKHSTSQPKIPICKKASDMSSSRVSRDLFQNPDKFFIGKILNDDPTALSYRLE